MKLFIVLINWSTKNLIQYGVETITLLFKFLQCNVFGKSVFFNKNNNCKLFSSMATIKY